MLMRLMSSSSAVSASTSMGWSLSVDRASAAPGTRASTKRNARSTGSAARTGIDDRLLMLQYLEPAVGEPGAHARARNGHVPGHDGRRLVGLRVVVVHEDACGAGGDLERALAAFILFPHAHVA